MIIKISENVYKNYVKMYLQLKEQYVSKCPVKPIFFCIV